jgi:hypothetical protein
MLRIAVRNRHSSTSELVAKIAQFERPQERISFRRNASIAPYRSPASKSRQPTQPHVSVSVISKHFVATARFVLTNLQALFCCTINAIIRFYNQVFSGCPKTRLSPCPALLRRRRKGLERGRIGCAESSEWVESQRQFWSVSTTVLSFVWEY